MNFVSDWAILNDAKPKQLERILAEFHHLGEAEIYRACILLENYHAVYRRDRLAQRRSQLTSGQSSIKRCWPPTATQLHEIAQRMNAQAGLKLGIEEINTQLCHLANRLRQYRVYVRTSLGTTAISDELNYSPKCHQPGQYAQRDRISSDDSENNGYIPFLQMFPI